MILNLLFQFPSSNLVGAVFLTTDLSLEPNSELVVREKPLTSIGSGFHSPFSFRPIPFAGRWHVVMYAICNLLLQWQSDGIQIKRGTQDLALICIKFCLFFFFKLIMTYTVNVNLSQNNVFPSSACCAGS